MNEDVAKDIESHIRARARIAPDDKKFSRRSPLWSDGYVDSIGMVELIVHLETRYAITLPDAVLFDDEFTTVDGMARVVERLRAARPDALATPAVQS